MANLKNLSEERAKRATDNADLTPVDTLRMALADIEAGKIAPTSLMVLHVKRYGDEFDSGWFSANLDSSQMIAIMEIVKATLFRDMGLT